jgi:hypothetical protein
MSRYTLTISCVLNMYGGCHEHEILPESGRASLTHGLREMHRRRDRTHDTAWSTGSVTVNGHCGRQEALCKTKLDKNLGQAASTSTIMVQDVIPDSTTGSSFSISNVGAMRGCGSSMMRPNTSASGDAGREEEPDAPARYGDGRLSGRHRGGANGPARARDRKYRPPCDSLFAAAGLTIGWVENANNESPRER